MTGVRLRDVTVAFDDVTALDGVSLTVRDGEFFTLVGPSGSGKTTALRTVAGFETPDAGAVEIGGAVADGPPEDRNVGVVFQDYALFPHMTVAENVGYGLRYRDPPTDGSRADRVAALLDLVDMSGMGDRDPASLSGGQRQRVALARALAPGPDVLLLDEPLSALDARLRERLRVVIREIQRDLGITTVYVTHDQREALAISDRVAVVHDGRVEQVATPETLYRAPATRFVAEFVGDNNVLDATVASTDPPRVRVGRDGSSPDAGAVLPVDSVPGDGDAVAVAIRPEALRIGDAEADATLAATVTTVEFVGDGYRVHCEWGDRTLLVTAPAAAAPAGEVTLGVDRADVTVLEAP